MTGPAILVGLMGAGKTTVGRLLADRAGLAFIDLDREIELRAETSVASLFREKGESAFRALEAAATVDLLAGSAVVAAVGGGWMANEAARAAASGATTVWLRVSPDEALRRIGEDVSSRPLLHGSDPLAALGRLAAERLPAYEGATYTVDTEGLSPAVVVDRVAGVLGIGST